MLRRHGVPVTLFVPTAFPDAEPRASGGTACSGRCAPRRARMLDTPRRPAVAAASRDERRAAYRACASTSRRCPTTTRWRSSTELVADARRPSRRQPGVLGWDALRELAAEGVALGGALAHASAAGPARARAPAATRSPARSADLRREHTGAAAPAFAYPGGGVSPRRAASCAAGAAHRAGVHDRARAQRLARGRLAARSRRINVGRRTGPLPVLRVAHRRSPRATARRRARPRPRRRGAGAARASPTSRRASRSSARRSCSPRSWRSQRRGVPVDVYPAAARARPVMHPEAAPLVAARALRAVPVAGGRWPASSTGCAAVRAPTCARWPTSLAGPGAARTSSRARSPSSRRSPTPPAGCRPTASPTCTATSPTTPRWRASSSAG